MNKYHKRENEAYPSPSVFLRRSPHVTAPRSRFSLPEDDGFSVWDLERATTVDPGTFLSLGHATPFAGMPVNGVCMATYLKGTPVYTNPETK